MEIISSNKLYDPLLDLNKVAGGTLSKNDEAMTWIENFSVVQARGDKRRKKRGSISSKVGTKIMKQPILLSKESITIPTEVNIFILIFIEIFLKKD